MSGAVDSCKTPLSFDGSMSTIKLTKASFQGYYQNSVKNIVVETFCLDMNKRRSMHEAAERLDSLWKELRQLPEHQARERFAEFISACDYRIVLTVGNVLKGDVSPHVPDVCQIVRVILWKSFKRMQERVYDIGSYVARISRTHAHRQIRKAGVITISPKVFSKDYARIKTCEVENCAAGVLADSPHTLLIRREILEEAQQTIRLWKSVLCRIKYRADYTAWTILREVIGLNKQFRDRSETFEFSPVARKCKVSGEAVRRFFLRSIGRAERATNRSLAQFIDAVSLCLA